MDCGNSVSESHLQPHPPPLPPAQTGPFLIWYFGLQWLKIQSFIIINLKLRLKLVPTATPRPRWKLRLPFSPSRGSGRRALICSNVTPN
ncbi:hypothetical protein TSUD_215720 [Trifolium subterraneum]|uniref:Uncharacterized protein n=1 Tax=Trifolium subterraneum TaxID=3900 RepID=A0A2Z6M6W0_TRISU|nr:hypothetical protein TSUD_215720 [Trifolium subterraneum]